MPVSWFKRRLHPFFSDVLLTGVTQGLILGANLFMVGLVSKWMGLAALGEYLLLKRVSAWLLSGSQLGLGVALPRQIAHSSEDHDVRARQYLAAAFASLLPLLAIVIAITALAAKPLARLCFGSENQDLVFALACLLGGSGLQAMLFGYFRGLQRMRSANLVQIGSLVAIPLIALLAVRSHHSTPLLVKVTGIGMAAVSVAWAVPILSRTRDLKRHLVGDARSLLTYGSARVPGDIADGALLALGPVLVAHYTTMDRVSYLLLGITCLSMTSLAFWPVVMMLLAKVSQMLGAGRLDDVTEYVRHLRSAVLQLSTLVMTQALIFVGPLVRWWLGPSYLPGIPVICTLILAIPGFMYYHGLRSVLDAASTVAYNTRNLVAGLVVFGVLSAAILAFAPRTWVLSGVATAMTATIYFLALATDRSIHAVGLARRAPELSSVAIVVLPAVVSLAAQWAFKFEITKPAFCMVQLINVALMLAWMRKSQPEWVNFVWRLALPRA